MGAQENKKLGTDTVRVGLEPSVEVIWTRSEASSPPVAVFVNGFSGKSPQVLLLQPGLLGELQVPHDLELANEH